MNARLAVITTALCVALELALSPALASSQTAAPSAPAAGTHDHSTGAGGSNDAAAPTPAAAGDQGVPSASWTWAVDSNVFAGYNQQRRKFTDFHAWESQNWLMASAARRAGAWTTTVTAGLTLEPATIQDIGSPQAFQTGETFGNAPLIDYQHPHDLVMALGADTTRAFGRAAVTVGAFVVGTPPIGPPPYMHRASAAENPQTPLSHHNLDSTHSTQGLVRAGVRVAGLTVNGGAFHGREPDENRVDVDLGRLDSYALQAAFARGRWSGQISNAWLTRPERLSPYDAARSTASLAYEWRDGERLFAWTAAVGQNREVHGKLEAYLFEATWRISATDAFYTRAEQVAKDILDAGFHPLGVRHSHRQSHVGAITWGYVRDVVTGRFGRLGLGGDVTGYRVPVNLQEPYGDPLSLRVFVRVRGRAGSAGAPAHVHH